MANRRGVAPAVVAVIAALIATSCSSSHLPAAHNGGAAPAAPAASTSENPTALTTTVQYSGVYDEKVDYKIVPGPQPGGEVTKHIHFTFRESVSLKTPRSALNRPITGSSPVSDSLNNKVSFQMSGSISDSETPAVGANCTGELSGVNGWTYSTTYYSSVPPVEIMIAGLNPDGGTANAKTYMMNIAANVPGAGDTTNGGSIIHAQINGPDGSGFCKQPGPNGGVLVKDPKCAELWHPGPRETAPGEPPLLVLPLDTKNYSRTYSCDYTDPISTPATAVADGLSGTDVISATGTLTVNDTLHLYAALGDSFSSGAINNLLPGPCVRSVGAYPRVYDEKGVVFLACSGASSTEIRDTQVLDIPPNAQIVSLTAGGDDLDVATLPVKGLFGVLIDCMLKEGLKGVNRALGNGETPCRDLPGIISLMAQLPTIQAHVTDLIHAIHEQAPDARIFVLGYPNPVPSSPFPAGTCPGIEKAFTVPLGGVGVTFPGISAANVSYLASVVDDINAAVRNAVTASGSATYVDPFTGHDVCARQSWFIPLNGGTPPDTGAPLHPNNTGQAAMAKALLDAAGPPPG